MRNLLLIIILLASSIYSQINIKDLKAEELPKGINFQGKFYSCVMWIDSIGENILVMSTTGEFVPQRALAAKKAYSTSVEGDLRSSQIYAYHYVRKNHSLSSLWKLTDYVDDCILQLTLEFLTPKALVTDLDTNGICETWIVYWLGCRSDVSALNLKLIMHEGQQKYAIRGTRKLKMSAEVFGGEMIWEQSFKKLPTSIVNYASELWEKYDTENPAGLKPQ